MNISEFIKKYSLFRTFYISELSDVQLNELESCTEFRDVKKFNMVNPNDKFFINNAIDFTTVKLKTNTRFNYKINLHSISIIGPFPTHDVYKMKHGLSQFKYVIEDDFKEKGVIVFKFDYDNLKEKFLTTNEIREFVYDELKKALEEEQSYECFYLIGIRAHKDSFLENHEFGTDIAIHTVSDSNKLF